MNVFPVLNAFLATAVREENVLETFSERFQEWRVGSAVWRVVSLPVDGLNATICKRRGLHVAIGELPRD